MTELSVKVKTGQFSALSHVYGREKAGLANIIRQMLVTTAQNKVWGASLSSFTDNSTGTSTLGAVANFVQPPSSTVTASLGEATASLTTSLGKTKNATLVMMNTLNTTRKLLGLPILSYTEGTQAAANTVPAQDTSGTGAVVGSTVTYGSALAATVAVKTNIYELRQALNEILVAIGAPVVGGTFKHNDTTPFVVLQAIPALASSADGTNSVLVTDATTFLASVANAFASLAATYNKYVPAAATFALTDSTTGTSAAVLAANASPAPAAGAATTSAPKAGFDTVLGVIKNAVSSLAFAYNELALEAGAPSAALVVDNSGGTVSSTLAAIAALTAVDGSTGTVAVDQATALARMTVVSNSLSSLGAAVSSLARNFDNVPPLGVDALGGVVGQTLSAIASTGTGVGGVTNVTLLNAAVTTWLAGTASNIASIATVINAANAMMVTTKPLLVIAG